MDRLIPHTAPPRWPESIGADRFAATNIVCEGSPAGCAAALLGLPDDLGVRLNHGRAGAREGPTAFRRALARMGVAFDADRARPIALRVYDAGDVVPVRGDDADALARTHERVFEAVAALHQRGMLPICVGGGHDLTYPAVKALAAAHGQALGGVNLDAHLDMRETPGSGMPFRRLIEEGCLEARRHTTLGLGAFVNSEAMVRWCDRAGARRISAAAVQDDPRAAVEQALRTAFPAGHSRAMGFVSVDLDSLDAAHAPGVSAMNPAGLSPAVAFALARWAGRLAQVQHLDIMELSPPHDHDERTARLAAAIFLAFVAGLDERLERAQ